MPSPVFQDDLQTFMFDDHSDWENYSDDYYDDDPSATRAADKVWESRRGKTRKSSHKMLKWSKHNVHEAPKENDITIATSSQFEDLALEEIIWRSTAPTKIDQHVPGQSQRVSLLENWREVFRDARPKPRVTQKEGTKLNPFSSSNKAFKRHRDVDNHNPAEDLISLSEDEIPGSKENPHKSRHRRKIKRQKSPVNRNGSASVETGSIIIETGRARQQPIRVDETVIQVDDSAATLADSSNMVPNSTRQTGKRLRSGSRLQETSEEPKNKRVTRHNNGLQPNSRERDRRK